MIFRSVGIQLPQSLLENDIGSFVVTSQIICLGDGIKPKSLPCVPADRGGHAKGGKRQKAAIRRRWRMNKPHCRYMSPLVLDFSNRGSGTWSAEQDEEKIQAFCCSLAFYFN